MTDAKGKKRKPKKPKCPNMNCGLFLGSFGWMICGKIQCPNDKGGI